MNNKLLPKGIYKFKIKNCNCNYLSKSGNKSIKLTLEIIYKEEKYEIHEYITKKLDPSTGKAYFFIIKKVKALLSSIHKSHLIGKILKDSDLIGNHGYASIKIVNADDSFGDSNKIDRFLIPEESKNFFENN